MVLRLKKLEGLLPIHSGHFQIDQSDIDRMLLRRFDGRTSAAVGSYNAGPTAVARWLKRASGEDDEWVESMAYDQTRGYVKRVLRSLHAYRVLY